MTFDVYKKLKPQASESQLVGVGRIVTVVMVGLGMLWVPFIKYLSSEVYIYLQSVQAYISPPIAAVFLFGVFWPRANRHGAIAALVVGAVLGAARFLFELNRGSAHGRGLAASCAARQHQLPALRDRCCSSSASSCSSSCRSPRRRNRCAKLRGLTFATLEFDYVPASERCRSLFRLRLGSTIALAVFVVGLWVYFA